jgi:hypothetical protein
MKIKDFSKAANGLKMDLSAFRGRANDPVFT